MVGYRRGTVSRLWLNTSGRAATTISAAPGLRRKSGGQHLDGGVRGGGADRDDDGGDVGGAPIGQVVPVNRGDDDVAQARVATASATRPGSVASSASGWPVRTLQKLQARVQISPMIIMVAWRWDQHSPMFGQAASSQTVTRPLRRIRSRVS